MQTQNSDQNMPRPAKVWFRKVYKVLLCFVIILCGMGLAVYITQTAPKASKRIPQQMSPLVQVEPVRQMSHTVVINAMGTVIPAREVVLKARVSGEIIEIHPEFNPGSFVAAGTTLLRIDGADYELLLNRKRSAVVNAHYALALEMGRQDVAKREWMLLNDDRDGPPEDAALALRRPHLEKVQADLSAAESDLAQARLNLERTRIFAPFNAIIREKDVEFGSQVGSQDKLAELVGVDYYWVQVSLPADRISWISIPTTHRETGAAARIFYHSGSVATGRVIKLLGDLESEGRMARLLISIADPLGIEAPDTGRPPLLIGEYVRVEIEGRHLDSAVRIPRDALRNNSQVWIAGPDNRLEIRSVQTLWRDQESVLIGQDLNDDELLIVSDLATPVAGMSLDIDK
ncbi:MAG: efflux RND transporter periplasmic adaptor subunit [Deltaproteobacteria bacterium]|nr:efflux RND transporter periplasmic adaptor subunit [Deltaproteobacteria bacterium]